MPKKEADNLFEENLSVEAKKAFWPPIAEWVAYMYYLAVKNGGAGAYARGFTLTDATGYLIER
jgi:hypothetical protein